MADPKELCDAKKERDVAIAKRDAWKKRLESGSSLECKQVAQASEQLTQCQRRLEVERREVQSLAKETGTMQEGCKRATSDLMRVMGQLNEKPQADEGELNKMVHSLEQEIQEWKGKYESMVAENKNKRAAACMRIKDLEDQMELMDQIFTSKQLESSERQRDLVSKISELERTVKEQEAELQKHVKKHK